jgi:hypothetical protein
MYIQHFLTRTNALLQLGYEINTIIKAQNILGKELYLIISLKNILSLCDELTKEKE